MVLVWDCLFFLENFDWEMTSIYFEMVVNNAIDSVYVLSNVIVYLYAIAFIECDT